MKTIWSFNSYKDFLNYQCALSRGAKTKIAAICECEKSYLSKVLNQEVHLTPDHGFKICEHFQFSSEEREYFMALLEYERASSLSYKNFLLKKIKSMAKVYEASLKKNERIEVNESSSEILYNSNWMYCAVNILTSIPEYQSRSKIAERLNITSSLLDQILKNLELMKYIKKQNNSWQYLSGAAHLSDKSPLVHFHHANWRNRALIDAQDVEKDGLHYTNVQSISEELFESLRKQIHHFINQTAKQAEPSPPEELVCLNLDFFKV